MLKISVFILYWLGHNVFLTRCQNYIPDGVIVPIGRSHQKFNTRMF